jgi:spermidine/putrescine-binding protein
MHTIDEHESGLIRLRSVAHLNRRSLLGSLVAAGSVVALGGLSRRARAATTIDYMGWLGYDQFLEAGDFLAAHDLTMEKTFINAPEEIAAKLRLNPGEVDVCVPYFIHLDFMAEEGLLQPLQLDKLSNWGDLFPTIKRVAEPNMTYQGQWYSAPFTWASICLSYNPKLLREPPVRWADMLKDEYKGKWAIPADLPSAFSTWGRVATDAPEPNRMTLEQLDTTVDFLINLKKNHLRTIAASYGELVDLLAREEIIMCQGTEPVSAWIGEGPEIRWTYPEEGCMSFIEGWSISAGSDNVDEAHALIDNSLSVAGQVAGATYNGMPVTNAKTLPDLDEWNRNSYPYDDMESFFTTKLHVDPMYLLESDGVHATWDDYIGGWERVLKA